jgi:hypothetical protein
VNRAAAPEGVWFAPGRVNLMGGPDYTETFVLPRRPAGATAGCRWYLGRWVRNRSF